MDEELGEHNILLLCTNRVRDRNQVIKSLRNRDAEAQIDRLEVEWETTTGLFRSLNELKLYKAAKVYIKCNPHMKDAIRLIHLIRAGNSELKGQQFPRHQAADDICRLCHTTYEKETPRHVIEECVGTQEPRDAFKETL